MKRPISQGLLPASLFELRRTGRCALGYVQSPSFRGIHDKGQRRTATDEYPSCLPAGRYHNKELRCDRSPKTLLSVDIQHADGHNAGVPAGFLRGRGKVVR